MKAPASSQSSLRGAEGEAALEVPAEEIRMSCFFLPPYRAMFECFSVINMMQQYPFLFVNIDEYPDEKSS